MAYIYSLNPRRKRRKVASKPRRTRRKTAVRVVRSAKRRHRSRSVIPFSRVTHRRRRHSLPRVIVRRAKRNPRVGFVDMLLYGAGGAAGGVAVDFLTNLVPLPSSLSTGIGLTGTKVALGLGAGYAVEKLWKREAAGYIASGILAVIFHEAFGATISGMLSSTTSGTAATGTATGTASGAAGLGMLQSFINQGLLNPSPIAGTAGMGMLMQTPVPTI